MSDRRRARKAKQVRRDARRAKKRNEAVSADTTLTDFIRRALAKHPVDLLSVASLAIKVAKPEPLRDETCLDNVLNGLIGVRNRETTALLAVVAELLVDDPAAQLRCRQELDQRDDPLPRWVTALPQIEVYRAVRRTHVLGDVDELLIGARLDGGHHLTVGVQIDHNMLSSIADALVVPDSLEATLTRLGEANSDTDVVEMTPADARAWIAEALVFPALPPETETWPLYRALVRWLVSRLPEGGKRRAPTDWAAARKLCDGFFATDSAAPFGDPGHRELLLELFETGSGDPLRWSAERVEHAMGSPAYGDGYLPLEVVLDAPDLLRAFIPYAHVQSGIRDELTSRALAVIDARRSRYKRELLRDAQWWDLDDAV